MENKTSNSGRLHTIYLSIILLLMVAGVWLLFDRNSKIEEIQETVAELDKTNSEKTEVTLELNKMLDQYEILKTDNDSLNTKLEAQQQRIEQLLEEVKNVRYSNAAALQQYKEEAALLRSIMREYIHQIDSLNTLNEALTAEVIQVKDDYRRVQDEKDQLITITDSLSSRVEIASIVKAAGMSIIGLKGNDSETEKLRKLEKIKICFSLAENPIAKKGTREIYVRIARPDNFILHKSGELFDYQGNQIAYSAKRSINYDGKAQDVCIFWIRELEHQMMEGIYNADIFMDGYKIGETKMELK